MDLFSLFKAYFGIKKKRRLLPLKAEGEHYDLTEIYNKLNIRYFDNGLNLRIAWTGNKYSKPRRRVMFGSYHQKKELIRIHRRLDRADVPDYFVSFIVYHEMLHHVLPPILGKNRRRRVHHPAFLKREKEFEDYVLAKGFNHPHICF
jgi:hypothetical protein